MLSVNFQPERQDCSWTASDSIHKECLPHANLDFNLKLIQMYQKVNVP